MKRPIGSDNKGSRKVEAKSRDATASPASGGRQNTGLMLRSSDKNRSKVITKKDELPYYESVISIEGGLFELSPALREKYAVLMLDSSKKTVMVVCAKSTLPKSGFLDHEYMSLTQDLKRKNLIRKGKLIADDGIISIIYESAVSTLSADELKRNQTRIQISFDELLRSAIESQASDIHIEVRRTEAKVRFRVNGDLFDFKEWSPDYARTMGSVIYSVIADEKDTSFDEARPQDALIDRDLGQGNQVRVRLATIPAYPSGFDMIMRVLRMGQDGNRQSLDKLGYEKQQLTYIRRAVAKPVGAVIMSGTTGSGKSTSLNSMLSEKISLYKGQIKVITVEDPPEYVLEGSTQVPVVRRKNSEETNPFIPIVRAAMRSDPDVLMVGEVRDEASAKLLIHAVQSGHQVFTTVHAGGGIDIISRLRSNGVPDDVLGGQNFISALMFQALIPTLCTYCSFGLEELKNRIERVEDEESIQRIYRFIKPNIHQHLRFENGAGCDKCSNGRTGRSVASEVILPDAYMLKCFREKQDNEAFLHYLKKGGKTALDHGIMKAFRGQMDIRAVESKLDQINLLEELHVAMMIDSNKEYVHGEYMIGDELLDDEKAVKDKNIELQEETEQEDSVSETEVVSQVDTAEKNKDVDGSTNSVKENHSPRSSLLGDNRRGDKAPIVNIKKQPSDPYK